MNNFFSPRAVVGEMYIIPADGYSISITSTGEYGPLTGFRKGKDYNIDVDAVNGTFTIKGDGCYKFDGVASVFPSAGMLLNFAVFVNDVLVTKINTALDFQNNQDTNTFSGTGWLDLKKGDVVTVQGESNNAPVTVNISNMNISIARRGTW